MEYGKIMEGAYMDKVERIFIQQQYTEKRVDHLPLLQTSINITQNQLAKRLGVTRSTMVVIEARRRPFQFHMYLTMVLVFMQEEKPRKLLESFELFDGEFIQRIL